MSEELLSKEDIADLEYFRQLKRASQGQSLTEQDIMNYLVNVKDLRERTRLKEHDCYGHSGMEFLATIFPRTFSFLYKLAEIENVYFISLDGQSRQEAILMTKAKTTPTTPLTIENIQNPTQAAQGQIQAQDQKQGKKHFWSRT